MTTRAGRNTFAELVALLHDLDHGALVGVGRLREQRLVHMGIELALGLDLGQSLLRKQIGQGTMDEPDTVLDLPLFMLRSSLERPPEIVEDRDQLLHEPLVRTLGERSLLARVPLAVVVELSGEPLQPVEELVAVSLESVDVDALLGLLCHLRLVSHYAFGASCSSSMTS